MSVDLCSSPFCIPTRVLEDLKSTAAMQVSVMSGARGVHQVFARHGVRVYNRNVQTVRNQFQRCSCKHMVSHFWTVR